VLRISLKQRIIVPKASRDFLFLKREQGTCTGRKSPDEGDCSRPGSVARIRASVEVCEKVHAIIA
jgi:hypothetical protein